MKKSQLRKLIREVVGGYESDGKGNLVRHNDKFDSTKLSNILMKVAKGPAKEEVKDIYSEDADKTRAEHLGTLRGYLEGNLIPKINMAVKRDGISQAFASELVSDIQKRLDMIKSSDSLSKEAKGPVKEEVKDLYSKDDAIQYIEDNLGAKYYKIASGRGVQQNVKDANQAIQAVQSSPIDQFELDLYGDTISFSAPYDEKHGAAVRAMGGLD
jgi:hypothetical protein